MSFRLKIIFMTTALIAILFSIGGVVLVDTTFQASLEKEEQAAVDNNELILKMAQLVGEDLDWYSETDLVSVLTNLCAQASIDCLQLTCEEEKIYSYPNAKILEEYGNDVTEVEENSVFVTYFCTEQGEKYLQTTTRFSLNGKIYYLDMGRSLVDIYHIREEQIEVFQKIFLVLAFAGLLFSWLFASVLTRSLRKLTKASKEIGSGNLAYRSGVKGEDEIGALAIEFDKMAEKLENNITLLKENAEQKEMFMGAFTHEMKTPMTSIIGYADLLRSQKLSEEDQEDALQYIFSEAKRLENMSLKMLDLFVADKKEIVMKECSPGELTRYVAKHLQNSYQESDVTIVVSAEQGICRLEPDLFQTLLINLWDNAKKSMENGGTIYVDVRVKDSTCFLMVKDSGKGIPPEAIKHLTEAFYRVDKARARKKGSAGLGLALCEKIVSLHQGSMHFESQEGIGTQVMVILNGGLDEELEK